MTEGTPRPYIHGYDADEAERLHLLDAETFDQGIADFYRTADRDGVFFYTFFKGTATLD